MVCSSTTKKKIQELSFISRKALVFGRHGISEKTNTN